MWYTCADCRHITDSFQRYQPRSVLRRFLSIGRRQHPLRTWNWPEVLLDQRQGLIGFKLPTDQQRGIIGLVVRPIEFSQILDGNALDIAAIANRRLAVVVPEIGGGQHAFAENAGRTVLAHFEFVANDGHFLGQLVTADKAVDHPIGLHPHRKIQILVAGRQRFVVVRPIHPGRAVK